MEKNKKIDSRIDIDNLSLKDHLNTSFDIDKITVSEDLIARTLKAVKESETQEVLVSQKNEIKKKQFPVRQVASAAAVVVLLLIGMNVLQNGLPRNSKNNTQISSDSMSAESASDEKFAADESATTDMNGEESAEINILDAEDSSEDTTFDNATSSLTAAETPNTESEVQKDGGGITGSYSGNYFISLFPFTGEEVELFTVTNKAQEVLTIESSKVQEFYTILDGFTLTQMDNNLIDTWDYKVEIKTTNQTYTILLGNGIQVNENENSNIYYQVDDSQTLLEQVNSFLK